jgi:tRNA 2-thiouridine synthesizing protein A
MSLMELDTCGLDCPLPLLKAKQALNKMAKGEQLKVMASDPGSWRDFKVYTDQSSNKLISRELVGKTYIYLLEKN